MKIFGIFVAGKNRGMTNCLFYGCNTLLILLTIYMLDPHFTHFIEEADIEVSPNNK